MFVDLSGIRVDLVRFKQVLCYVLVNIGVGIWVWVVTWNAVANIEDNYAKPLAITGLVACLTNNVSCLIGTPFVIFGASSYRNEAMREIDAGV